MKRLLIASALMMAMSGVASADDRWKEQREYEKERYEAQREYEKDRYEAQREYEKDRRKALREYGKDRRKALKERAKAERRWARGEHLPREYMLDTYYVRDYGAYDLAPPPRGYRWVRPDPRDDRYYLVQIATGVIAQILGH